MTAISSLISRLFGRADAARETVRPLWQAVVNRARAEHWYVEGQVPDTLDGRFDMVALVLSITLLRIEESPEHARHGVWLTELFVADMDSQMRQIGFGDVVVGKQMGRVMGALGGRLGAYRAAFDDPPSLAAALVRNVWRGEAPEAAALAHVTEKARELRAGLAALPVAALVTGAAWPEAAG